MIDSGKNLMIGFFVVAAFAIITFMLLFLHPTAGDDSKVIKIRFADIDKINTGTRVTYGGRPVGEVTEIREIFDPLNPRISRNGFVYLYEVTAVVDSSVQIYNSDIVALKTAGLLGDKSIAITPMPPKPDQQLELIDDTVIYANEGGSLEETLKEFKELSDKFEETLDGILTTIRDINQSKLVDKVTDTVENLRDITASLNDKEKWTSILSNIHKTTEESVTVVKGANDFFTQANRIAQHTAAGEGTIGRFFMREDSYLKVNSIMSKAETLMDDINHFGLLFQSDPRWQRLRARRRNLLYTLQTPQEFRNFFDDEMNQITTSLARVNMVLEETSDECRIEELIENCEFKKVLAALIRRVKSMEESIQMYNQQVMERDTLNTEFCR